MFRKEGTNTWAIVIDQLKSTVPSSFIQNWYLWFIEMGFLSTHNTTYLHFHKHTDINLIIVIKCENILKEDKLLPMRFFSFKQIARQTHTDTHNLLAFNCMWWSLFRWILTVQLSECVVTLKKLIFFFIFTKYTEIVC